jgi:hypothetical protein
LPRRLLPETSCRVVFHTLSLVDDNAAFMGCRMITVTSVLYLLFEISHIVCLIAASIYNGGDDEIAIRRLRLSLWSAAARVRSPKRRAVCNSRAPPSAVVRRNACGVQHDAGLGCQCSHRLRQQPVATPPPERCASFADTRTCAGHTTDVAAHSSRRGSAAAVADARRRYSDADSGVHTAPLDVHPPRITINNTHTHNTRHATRVVSQAGAQLSHLKPRCLSHASTCITSTFSQQQQNVNSSVQSACFAA